MGECNKKTSFEILDYFYESGGNFIDTANNYQVLYISAEQNNELINCRKKSLKCGLASG